MKRALVLLALTAIWAAGNCLAQPGAAGNTQGRPANPPDNTPRTLSSYFTPATAVPKAPDADGFIQRWLLLEPIDKPNRTNTVFTDTYVRTNLNTEYFPNQFTAIPNNGDKVKAGEQELAWHALDSTGFNVKLFRFAYGLNQKTYGVIFWAVTVTDLQNSRQHGLTGEADCERQRFCWRSDDFRRFGSGWGQEGPFPPVRRARLRWTCPRGLFA